MKTCLKCRTITMDDSDKVCRNCGSSEFRQGRPKNWQSCKIVGTEEEHKSKQEKKDTKRMEHRVQEDTEAGSLETQDLFKSDTIGVKDWVIKMIILTIPLVNIIYAIIGVASKKNEDTIRNYFKAYLIVLVITYIVGAVLGVVLEPMITNYMYTTY